MECSLERTFSDYNELKNYLYDIQQYIFSISKKDRTMILNYKIEMNVEIFLAVFRLSWSNIEHEI